MNMDCESVETVMPVTAAGPNDSHWSREVPGYANIELMKRHDTSFCQRWLQC